MKYIVFDKDKNFKFSADSDIELGDKLQHKFENVKIFEIEVINIFNFIKAKKQKRLGIKETDESV
jgi:hypothetical protein